MGDIQIPDNGLAGFCPEENHLRFGSTTVTNGVHDDDVLEAPPSIGLVFEDASALSPGAMAQDNRHRGLFLRPLSGWVEIVAFLLGVARNSQEGGTRLCIKVPVTHGVTLDMLKVANVHWRNGIPIRCEGFVPVHGHKLISGIAYFGSVENSRRPYQETVLGEHALWHKSVRECDFQAVDISRVELLVNPSEDDIDRIIEIYGDSFDKYLCDLGDRDSIREMVTGSMTVVIREDDRIVAIAIAEHISLQFPDFASVNFIEISDVAVSPDARAGGYAKAMYQRLIELCNAQYGQGSNQIVITTEIRAICEQLHRIMVRCAFAMVGFQPSHCAIQHDETAAGGLRQNNGYGDLVTCTFDPQQQIVGADQDHWWTAYE